MESKEKAQSRKMTKRAQSTKRPGQFLAPARDSLKHLHFYILIKASSHVSIPYLA